MLCQSQSGLQSAVFQGVCGTCLHAHVNCMSVPWQHTCMSPLKAWHSGCHISPHTAASCKRDVAAVVCRPPKAIACGRGLGLFPLGAAVTHHGMTMIAVGVGTQWPGWVGIHHTTAATCCHDELRQAHAPPPPPTHAAIAILQPRPLVGRAQALSAPIIITRVAHSA